MRKKELIKIVLHHQSLFDELHNSDPKLKQALCGHRWKFVKYMPAHYKDIYRITRTLEKWHFTCVKCDKKRVCGKDGLTENERVAFEMLKMPGGL